MRKFPPTKLQIANAKLTKERRKSRALRVEILKLRMTIQDAINYCDRGCHHCCVNEVQLKQALARKLI